MHICIVIDCYYDKGNGTSISARNCVRELLKRGIDVTVFCAESTNRDKVGNENVIEFEVMKIPFYQRIIEGQHAQLARPNEGRIFKNLKGVNAVHIFMPFFLGTSCMKIAHLMSIPILGCYHLSAQNITYNAHMRCLLGATSLTYDILKQVHYKRGMISDIYCPSRYIAKTLLAHGYRQNLHIISNGYEPLFKKTTSEYTADDIIISSIGRFTREKRQDIIIRAIAKCHYKDKITLYLAGKGAKQRFYERLAKKLGVKLEITYLNRTELTQQLNKSYLYIQASDVETEGIACLEAIACGAVPIISDAKMCATKQFALDRKNLFRHGSPKALAKKIDYWIKHRSERNQKSIEYAEFAKKYSLEKHVDSLMEVYKNMISNSSSINRYIIRDYNENLKFEFICDDEKSCLIPNSKQVRQFAKLMQNCLK